MIRKLKYFNCLIIAVLLIQCKERFEPNLPIVPQGYLVVDGFINAQGVTQIKLSRTTSLDQKKTQKPELNATLQIQGEDNSSYSFITSANGTYSSTSNTLNPSTRYRLRIKTKDNKEYLSDYASVKITPAMDSVSWAKENDGVRIYVTTHDDQKKSIYYRWEYDETWEIHSAYFAYYKYANTNTNNYNIVSRGSTEPNIFYCWKYDTLRNIVLQSSEKLTKDIISLKPLRFIPYLDEKLGVRYSIQVKQYVLDKEGYQFYELLRKNTESLGTIFDPQPSVLTGNIHSLSDPNELVIGYIGVTTMQQQRIFIDASGLGLRVFNILNECPSKDVPNHADSLAPYSSPNWWPYDAVFQGPAIKAYRIAESRCVDCRLRGGNNTKPSFW
jgi:hypothetical protein